MRIILLCILLSSCMTQTNIDKQYCNTGYLIIKEGLIGYKCL